MIWHASTMISIKAKKLGIYEFFKQRGHRLSTLWTQLRGASFCPCSGLEMRSAFLKTFKQVFDECVANEFGKCDALKEYFDYLSTNYFNENARYPAQTWTFFDPNGSGLDAESSTNNASEHLHSLLNSMIPSANLKFSSAVNVIMRFHRRLLDSKYYLQKEDKLLATGRRSFVIRILRAKIMQQFPAILAGRNKYQKSMDLAKNLGWASHNAKQICSSNENYQKWLDDYMKKNPGIENTIPSEFRTNLEEEQFIEQLLDLSSSMSELSQDDIYQGLWGQ